MRANTFCTMRLPYKAYLMDLFSWIFEEVKREQSGNGSRVFRSEDWRSWRENGSSVSFVGEPVVALVVAEKFTFDLNYLQTENELLKDGMTQFSK